MKDEVLHMEIKDAISKSSVYEILGNLMAIPYELDRPINEKDVSKSMDEINALPPVLPMYQQGKWIKEYDNSALDGLYHCSVCGRKLWIPKEESVSDYQYCHCGSRNEVE